MTEKRFRLAYEKGNEAIFEDLALPPYPRRMTNKEVERKLNEQQATIQSLKEENEQLKERNQELFDDLQSKTSWLSLRGGELAILKRENEQLKDKIDVLEDDNETYHKSLEKLNLYTKRFIPTKCAKEFKDCKTNRYYWLDHEGNFEGCLELLNLLDCENEVLKFDNRELKGRLMLYEEQIKGDLNGRL